MGKGNKSRWQAFGGGGWREMMFVFYFGKFFGVCGAFFGGRISERGQLGFWAPVACPGRTGPIVHIVCQLSLGDLQPLDVGIPVVLLFPALLSILVVHVHTLCNWCKYCPELLYDCHITTIFCVKYDFYSLLLLHWP